MVDDHHGTASMTMDATTQAVTRRYTKPFGETRGATPSTWPDDKGFLGKPADADTGLTDIGAREYDPSTGRFLSVDPILALDDHESLNGYAYANNTPVTLADPTGLRADGACGGASSSCGGGTETWTLNDQGGWDWSYTRTYAQPGTSHGATGTFTTVVTQTKNSTTAEITFKKGPEPVPARKTGNGGGSGWGWLSDVIDYGSVIFSEPEIWWGAAETAGSMMLMGLGGDSVVGGGALCLTGIGCLGGGFAVAGGVALIGTGATGAADGIGRISDGLVLQP